MNSAILAIIEQHQAVFMDRLSEQFEIPRDQMEEVWMEVRKMKMKKMKKVKKVSVPSAYVLFCRAKRESLDKDLDFGKISKELGKMWRDITPEEKLIYTTENNRLRREKIAAATLTPESSDAEHDDDHQAETETTAAAASSDSDSESVTKSETVKAKKDKAIRKKKGVVLPDDIAERSDADQQLWIELSKLKLADLRIQCKNRNLPPAKTREEMLRALVCANRDQDQDQEEADDDMTQIPEEEEEEEE